MIYITVRVGPVKTMACNDASKVRIAIDLGYEELMNDKVHISITYNNYDDN